MGNIRLWILLKDIFNNNTVHLLQHPATNFSVVLVQVKTMAGKSVG